MIESRDISYEFPGTWYFPLHELLIAVGKTLMAHDIKGRGVIHLKNHRDNEDEYLLACSVDEGNWDFYFIKPFKQTITPTFREFTNRYAETQELSNPY